MSQQYQQPTGSIGQQSYGTQGTGGQQMGGQQTGTSHQMTHQKVGHQFESELTPELNEALEAFDRVVEISSWCADKCIEMGPEMAECARLCDDLSELAELNEKLIARDSINGPEIAEAFLRVAQQGMPILQQYQQTPHVQETLQAVDQAINSTNKLLSSIGGVQQAQQTQQSFQELAQQPQSQQFQQPQSQQFQQPQGQLSQQPQSQQFGGPQSY
jgi:hypothetical protein